MVYLTQNHKHCTLVNDIMMRQFSVNRVPINKQVCVLYVQKIKRALCFFGKMHPWDVGRRLKIFVIGKGPLRNKMNLQPFGNSSHYF